MKKELYPILEFDNNSEAKINPEIVKKRYPALPENLIITFFKEVIKQLLEESIIELFITITGENDLAVYKFINADACIIHGIIGGAACGGFYDELIALGVRKTMFCGGGGALRKDLTVGKLIVVSSAIRDEGMSYHYLPPSREADADPSTIKIISDYLTDIKLECIVGKVWTTDAFFRETEDKIKFRTSEGALLVEMEQAGLIAVSAFRKVKYGAIIYAGDDLTNKTWDFRGWHNRSDLRRGLVEICLQILKRL